MWRLLRREIRIGRVVAKFVVLDEMPKNIDPKPVDASLQPESHHVVDGVSHFAIAPVEIRLLAEKCVVIILPRPVIERPRTAAELRKPVVRRSAFWFGIAPDVPVAF